MRDFLYFARKIFLCLSGIIIGVFIFLCSSTLHINYNFFNPTFHEKLFVKHDIYSGTTYLLETSISRFITYVKEVSPESYEEQKEAFDLLEQTTSKETVTQNLDYLRQGIYEYMSDQRKFLPDITLKSSSNTVASQASSTTQTNSIFSNISKINLGAVLMYANRNDIVDYLAILKLVYYSSNKLPGLLLPVILLFSVISFFIIKDFKQLYKWLTISMLTIATLFTLVSTSLLIYVYFLLPKSIYPITLTLSMDSGPILSYIKDCTNPFSLLGLAISVVAFALGITFFRLSKRVKPGTKDNIDADILDKKQKIYLGIKFSLIGFIIILLTSSIYVKVEKITKDYKDNDFEAVIYKMKGVETMTQVIPAQDDFVHNAQIKVIDEKTQTPIKNIKLNVSGKNEDNGKMYTDSQTTNEYGQATFSLDSGKFRLIFHSPTFPSTKYKLPSPIFFELSTPGTKVITVNLEAVSETQVKTGYSEIEVLDIDNKPLSGAELQVSSAAVSNGYPDYVSSVSNAQGIAVFKLSEGSYKVKFNQSKLPSKYTLPSEFTIEIKGDKTSRYTIRLTTQ